MKKLLSILLLVTMLYGCATADPTGSLPETISSGLADSQPYHSHSSTPQTDLPPEEPLQPSGGKEEGHAGVHPYLAELVSTIANSLLEPEMSEYQRAKAAFDYMVENTCLDEPIGLELWRIYQDGEAIPFVEQRAISPLRFGVGMCEDYAAALTLLLRGMGMEAEYVPGLTYSLEGHLVDHAWTMVSVDGVWYHLDCQLEDNISIRRGTVRYRYFLKSDETFASSHMWGERLAESGLLTQQQNAWLVEDFLLHECPWDYPTPPPHQLGNTTAPDLIALQKEAQQEMDRYKRERGPLPPLELNDLPPVFGLAGYGPAGEG